MTTFPDELREEIATERSAGVTVETFRRNLQDKQFVTVPWSDVEIDVAIKVFADVLIKGYDQ